MQITNKHILHTYLHIGKYVDLDSVVLWSCDSMSIIYA